MVDCPNGKGIQHAAFLFPLSLSGPWSLDSQAPAPWAVQVPGAVTPAHRESTVCAHGEHRDRRKRKEDGGDWAGKLVLFQERKIKGKNAGIDLVLELMLRTLEVIRVWKDPERTQELTLTNPLPFGVKDPSLLICLGFFLKNQVSDFIGGRVKWHNHMGKRSFL